MLIRRERIEAQRIGWVTGEEGCPVTLRSSLIFSQLSFAGKLALVYRLL